MANTFIPVRINYSGSTPTGFAEYQTSEAMQLPGSLNFSGNGRRITGDMSTNTLMDRVAFQTSVANGNSQVTVLPNGTGTQTQVGIFSRSDISANYNYFDMTCSDVIARLRTNAAGTATPVPLTFEVAAGERLRIDTSGRSMFELTDIAGVALGTTARPGCYISAGSMVSQCNTGLNTSCSKAAGYSNSVFTGYFVNGATVGSITTNGTTTAYNTTSDYRLKDGIEDADAAQAWERLSRYRVRSFVFKAMPGRRVDFGGVAHELAEVNPDMVTGEKDGTEQLGALYAMTPVGDFYSEAGELLASGIEEPQEHVGRWVLTGHVEVVIAEDVPVPVDALPGVRWERTSERMVTQGVDWSKPVPELILNQQTAKAKIIALEVRAAEQDARIADLEARLQQLLDRLSA